ncbi:hypothetical protein P153DRAFT_363224 [Dothidotthia symphoricarpi CBS 119687]|uniref:NACHT domain-containing protein n=1 Tax=Dothidotthia symphoricarpi CBS 119687 TaxID=1392245 RepID=A0A6A6ATG2_9PLEO|nr:uncharacterized protein P153DRAFT_363224 [Dothidotthia symphoricarpi CBS 119687]KAF2134245.1 hypothetical protein P153DRAFT_363224 [Dothidotthia symphoricarpi CBS 119687]
MKPIPAVGLSSAISQLIDFSINVLRKDNAIYQPTTPVENSAVLQDVIDNLYRLTDVIDNNELKKSSNDKTAKLSEAAQQLVKLSEDAKEATNPLIDALIAAQAKGSFGDPRWPTARDALMNGVWKKKQVTDLKRKVRTIRKDVDTALLLALRQHLDQSAEAGLPTASEEDTRLHHCEKWQNEALDAVQTNEWKPKNKKNLEVFSKLVDKLIVAENEAHFCAQIFERLGFKELDDRLCSIPTPLEGTFEWVFGERQEEMGGLLEWFGNTRGENLFWITGKPGSGKTVLMKYLFRNPRVFDSLEAWSGHSPGITSGFFFWNSGTELQKSPLGALRSLLFESLQDMIYGPLEQDLSILHKTLFPDRWEQFISYGGGLHEFSFPELLQAFELMIADDSKKFLFIIDGLDELEKYSDQLPDILISATKMDHVKVCVSSRPSPLAQTAFEKRPTLIVDVWNKNDIEAGVMDAFDQDNGPSKLRGATESEEERYVVNLLTEKASGVFLWVTLATYFLIQGTSPSDDFSTFQRRAAALPSDIDDLLSHMLQSFNTTDLEQLWQLSALIESHGYPDLLPLSYALTADTSSTIAADVQPIKSPEVAQRTTDMRNLLRYTCKNLFSIYDTTPPDTEHIPSHLKVTYTHRAIREYLRLPRTQRAKPLLTPSTTDAQWANAHLMALKTLDPSASESSLSLWGPLSACLESALSLYTLTSKLPYTYIDAAGSCALALHTQHPHLSDLPSFPSLTHRLETFLDIAAWLNIPGFVILKAKQMKTVDKRSVKHALDFSREMRKRLGKGGEERWLAGSEKLRVEYGRNRVEVEGLLDYYARTVRLSKKPIVDVPEYV